VAALLVAGACGSPPQAGTSPGAASKPAAQAGSAPTTAAVAPTAAPPAVHVRFATQNSASDAAAYVAYERGFFKQEGIDFEFVSFSNASEMIPSLATEQVETAGIGGNPAMWNAVARGVPMKVVLDKASFTPGHGNTSLAIRKDVYDAGRGRRLDDLRGLTLAVTPPGKATTNACALASAMQRTNAGTLDDLTIQQLPFPDMVAALVNGSVDGALIAEPFLTHSIRQGATVRVMGQDEMYPNFTVGVVAYTPALYANHAAAKGFARAWLRGIREYDAASSGRTTEADRAQIDDVLARYTRIDVATIREMIPTGYNPNGLPNRESMLHCYNFFRDLTLIPEPVSDAQFAALWGTDLVEEVLNEVGRLPES
jgi:NitT/TauT family transport system substrate-binding protein